LFFRASSEPERAASNVVPAERLAEFCPAWAEAEAEVEAEVFAEAFVPESLLLDGSVEGLFP
jgi:hypothetical protein